MFTLWSFCIGVILISDWCKNPIKKKRNYIYIHTNENYTWLTNFVMVIEMANRLMEQIMYSIHSSSMWVNVCGQKEWWGWEWPIVASPRPNCAGDDFPDFWLCYEMEGAMCRLSLVFVKAPHATQFYPEEMPASMC